MFVKRLEMHGFKSFADKTSFELTPGITVVVGPNGCGKSNITDAVRWVLGEQSARHLRGTRMDDIIFGGAAGRKPLSFAEVSITLDHADGALGLDYQEVTVTRRLYKSGESEYLLNKRQCRLKDIVELFMDTGIGKEAYSFIGQGRVDEILNARPEERRQIFEEAAGILKYKTRKREAERRLAETAENLLRVGDIIHELAGQVEPLQLQAESARNYLELRDALKGREVNILVHDGRQMRRRWYDVEDKIKVTADELLTQQATVGRRENELAANQLTLDEEQAKVAEMQREANRLAQEVEKAQSRTALTREKINGVERQLEEGKSRSAELQSRQEALISQSGRVGAQLEEGTAQLEHAQKEQKAARLAIEEMEMSPEALRAAACREERDRLGPEIRRLQQEYDRVEMEREQLTEKIGHLAAEQEVKAADVAELQAKGQALLGEKDELLGEKAELESLAELARKELDDNNLALEKLAAIRTAREKELAETENRIRLLTELDDAMAGYHQGVKSVLSAQKKTGQFPGILGTVADVMDVPATYVAAVEAALGTALQNLVTRDEETAKDAISHLKKTNGGRATFLPLTLLDVQPRKNPPSQLADLQGYIGVAADLVHTEKKFTPVIEQLLARVHVVNTLDDAVPVARALRFRERVVTLDGDVMLPGGAMTGGREKRQGGILSRRKEADALQEEKNRRLAELEEHSRAIAAQEAIRQDIAAKITSLEEKGRTLAVSLASKENEILFLVRQEQVAVAVLNGIEKNKDDVSVHLEQKAQAMQRALDTLENYQEKEQKLRVEAAQLDGLLSAREQEKRSLQEHYTECRVRLASLQKQQEHLEEELERLESEQKHLTEREARHEEELRTLKTERLELAGLLEATDEETAALSDSRAGFLTLLMERENQLKEKNTQFREETENLRQLEKSLTALERKQARLELEKNKVEVELQAVLDRLRESWELEFDAAEKLAVDIADRKAVQEEIQQIKVQISELGTVNLGAIDEFQRVTERVDFLTAQREDLREGERDLLRIIREIDSRMGEKFASSFAVINENFSEVFKELFGGGRAHLRLTDPESPLEAGIEIVAQPPGKKLQHLSLLSGGEKALTAIALLFAFLKVKPTPFCILDEIEAALDEANLTRFTGYLKNLCGETQFILISHRKKTMEQADILYGVTMEESGVSKLISVRLRDDEKESPPASA